MEHWMYGGFGLLFIFFLIALAIITLFVPFFIFRIRNEAIETNNKLDRMITILAAQTKTGNQGGQSSVTETSAGNLEEKLPENTFAYKMGTAWAKFTEKHWFPGY